VEHYGLVFHRNPVGTGPFRLKEWTAGRRLILERNPTYRAEFYPAEGAPGDKEAGLLKDAGKRLPLVDEYRVTCITDTAVGWGMFARGLRGSSGISKDAWPHVMTPEKTLKEEVKALGIRLLTSTDASSFYVTFNMDDPVVGGYDARGRKLRQAMSLAFDQKWRIENLANGRAIPSQGILPPGIFGYDPEYRNPYAALDLEKARKLMAEAGYPKGTDPETGKPLTLKLDYSGSGPAVEQIIKVFQNEMAQIGIRIVGSTNTWPEFLRKRMEKKLQIAGGSGWILDYPDPQNFLQLFYGPNKSPGPNSTNYDHKEYDALYDQMKSMEDTPERLVLIVKMRAILNEDCPAIWDSHPTGYVLHHGWVRNAKPHGITGGYLKYRDYDADVRDRRRAMLEEAVKDAGEKGI
jgi:peptide/nickel transport system substrate-binding protein